MREGWQVKTLGDVCEFQRGLTYTKSDEVDVSDNIVLRATNIDLSTNLLSFDELKYISGKVAVPNSKIVKKGSLLICTASGSKSHLGKVAFIDDDYGYAFGGFMGMLTPLKELLPKYLFHLMTSKGYKDFIGALSDGANINNLKSDDLNRFPVPVPPLPEQQRIVALLDEAFAGLATAKANAERNLQNARAIFESHLQSVFSQRGEGWVEKQLEDVCVIGDGNHSSNYPKKEELVRAGIPFIRATNLVAGGISDEDMRYLSPEKHAQLKKGHLKTGDILFTNRGEIGKTAIVDVNHDGSNLNSQIAWLRCGEILSNRLLFHVLNSNEIKSFLELSKNGAALQQFTIRQIKELKIPIPPKDLQGALVVRLDRLLEETQHLTRLYERKLAALEELKKSLLHQAFSGEL